MDAPLPPWVRLLTLNCFKWCSTVIVTLALWILISKHATSVLLYIYITFSFSTLSRFLVKCGKRKCNVDVKQNKSYMLTYRDKHRYLPYVHTVYSTMQWIDSSRSSSKVWVKVQTKFIYNIKILHKPAHHMLQSSFLVMFSSVYVLSAICNMGTTFVI